MRQRDLQYPDFPDLFDDPSQPHRGAWYGPLFDDLVRYSRLAAEFGYEGESSEAIAEVRASLEKAVAALRGIASQPDPDPDEPETLEGIRQARPDGVRRLSDGLPADYGRRLKGSLLGRGAGCTLGAGLEFRSVSEMEKWARSFGDVYPLRDYWPRVKNPGTPRYIVGISDELTRGNMDCIPVDDDTGYTLIGLLTLEEHGPGFTAEQLAETWKRHIPIRAENGSWGCYWGERNLLQNLHRGVPVGEAGFLNNPNVQSVAAWTRADAWGYAAPGWPEKAAELAYRDASINHRRNGVYGSMFFAAAVSAAFCCDEPLDAVRAGLAEIPRESLFAEAVRWCLEIAPGVASFREGAAAVRERYAGMFNGHAINNACFVVLGLAIGGRDFTRVIGETVAMGMDNDCTGATAGSICGAIVGPAGIPEHWTRGFQNRMRCYFDDCPDYIDLDDLVSRFMSQAGRVRGA